ncbi:hypothetical protein A2709_01110 [candidate division WWE3 bacterium RIFCSPHIGHO2_01_FULL_43_9]|uniref:Aspartyl/glutamyl-tRNA(Asn/Gln) amidotransferase subunit B n=1 Tax=candidate division WWE3 bacterium RIFCSPHIGHO2_01_FULL_43_9 TaxID=1802618 RepID=A0A1F4V5D4_UNCKA|nr:MAG: hypothetical protein A2709_01110 [candidate division WWE3 bacterium RIFCSPHIGHO2_01_FULL_43_9]
MKLVLGLEIHIQVNAKHKMFCGCLADIWQAEPNSHTCPTCLGLPGALPVPNFEAVQKAHKLGMVLNCVINTNSHFDRKHYFYPDLPKGYQISQYKEPLCGRGCLELNSGYCVDIERVHLEEDTAKSFHADGKTLIDFNKSGIALIEIVTAPCFVQVADAVEFCKKVQDIARVCDVSDADMEKGNMRLEANISLRTAEMEQAGILPTYKVEVKNINSFRFMEKAVLFELNRQTELFDSGQTPKQENRGWDEKKQGTVSQRTKEEAHDYRYFPDPDIPPLHFSSEYIAKLKQSLPELPHQLKIRLVKDYGLKPASAEFFVSGLGIELVPKFERVAMLTNDPVGTANVLINKAGLRTSSSEDLAKEVVQKRSSHTLTVSELTEVVSKVIVANPEVVANYKGGKESALQFLVGQCMRETQGKADPRTIIDLLKQTV